MVAQVVVVQLFPLAAAPAEQNCTGTLLVTIALGQVVVV